MNYGSDVAESVERIAQLSERTFLSRSPLHLAPCGGCGGPSFQQPCPLCSYYPMGSDKGTWHPKRASREFFCEKVAASAPAGSGNLATWVLAQAVASPAYREISSYRRAADLSMSVAVDMEMPDAGLVFDIVSGMECPVHRERAPHEWSFWEVVDAVRRRPSTEARRVEIVGAVDELHVGSFVEACLRIREVLRKAMLEDAQPSWDLRRALGTLDRITPPEEATSPPSPGM